MKICNYIYKIYITIKTAKSIYRHMGYEKHEKQNHNLPHSEKMTCPEDKFTNFCLNSRTLQNKRNHM